MFHLKIHSQTKTDMLDGPTFRVITYSKIEANVGGTLLEENIDIIHL